MAITFDAANKRIILDSAYVTATELYSAWKEWAHTGDNLKYLPAFRTLGGDPLGGGRYVSPYFFLMNGWKIRPQEASHTLVIDGNITSDDGLDPVVPTLGNYRVLTEYVVPERAQAIATTGGGGASASEIAAAIQAALAPQLEKIDRIQLDEDDKVVADCSTTPLLQAPLKRWSGTEWEPA